ncbi:MAG: hypothetical protein D3916_14845 [Candidatus Electrothrix sp. MAN1_4]|nr:hypothetical protein [Candidatus Electrothrix sp. MAN1_4]
MGGHGFYVLLNMLVFCLIDFTIGFIRKQVISSKRIKKIPSGTRKNRLLTKKKKYVKTERNYLAHVVPLAVKWEHSQKVGQITLAALSEKICSLSMFQRPAL